MSVTATARLLIGRRIVAFDPGTKRYQAGPNGRITMHDARITLDNGAVIFFAVEEEPNGGDYGVEARYHRPRNEGKKEG